MCYNINNQLGVFILSKYNYRELRLKYNGPTEVDCIPPGGWMPISTAAKRVGLTHGMIRFYVFAGEIDAIRLKWGGSIHVNLDQIQELRNRKIEKTH